MIYIYIQLINCIWIYELHVNTWSQLNLKGPILQITWSTSHHSTGQLQIRIFRRSSKHFFQLPLAVWQHATRAVTFVPRQPSSEKCLWCQRWASLVGYKSWEKRQESHVCFMFFSTWTRFSSFLLGSKTWFLACGTNPIFSILWMEEILHQLVDGLSMFIPLQFH